VKELEGGRHVEEGLGVAEEEDPTRIEPLVEEVDHSPP